MTYGSRWNKFGRRIVYSPCTAFEPENEPYFLCYSGGKDSDTIRILAKLAGVKHELHYSVTSVDPPESVRYVKQIEGVIMDYPRYKDGKVKTMWNLIPKKKIPPTRLIRYCCTELKEQSGKGFVKITGVRLAESVKRAKSGGLVKIIGKPKTTEKIVAESGVEYEKPYSDSVVMNFDNADTRRVVEHCYRTTSTMVNPIYDWSDTDVWEFLRHYGCEGNPCYQMGMQRIGCIGCPMAGKKRYTEFQLYPKYKDMYMKAFEKMLVERAKDDRETDFRNAEEVYQWWMQCTETSGQLSLFDENTEY